MVLFLIKDQCQILLLEYCIKHVWIVNVLHCFLLASFVLSSNDISDYGMCIIFLRLQKEVHEIRETVRVLKEKLRRAEDALVRLRKTRSALQHDISIKENSLSIDSKYCMGMRQNMAMNPKVGPMGSMPCY